MSRPAYAWLLAGVFALALGLRVGVSAYYQGLGSPPDVAADEDQKDYEEFAAQLAAGKGYSFADSGRPTACRPPGTSFTLLPVYLLTNRCYLAARLWFCFLSAATCLVVAWAARPWFGRRAAVLAAAWLAAYPGHFYYSMHFLSETPAGLYLALACGASIRAVERRAPGWDVIAGLFWGMTILTRPQLLPVVGVGWLVALFAARTRGREVLVRALLQTIVLSAVVGAWVARNVVVMGGPTLSTTTAAYTFWGAHNDKVNNDPAMRGSWLPVSELKDDAHPLVGDELERDRLAWRYGLEWVREHTSEMPGLVLMKLWRLVEPFPQTSNRVVRWAFALGWLGTAPFLLAGLFVAARRHPAATWVLALPLLGTLLAVVVFNGYHRFRDGLAPAFVVFAGVALDRFLPGKEDAR